GVFTADTIPADSTKDSLLIGVVTDDNVTITDRNFSKNIIHSGGEELIIIQNLKTKEIISMTMREWRQNLRANERKYGKLPKPPVPPVPPVPPTPTAAPEPPVPVVTAAPQAPE